MSDSAADLANLAHELDEAELTADPTCPSLAQVLWDSLDHQQLADAKAFTGFDGISAEQP